MPSSVITTRLPSVCSIAVIAEVFGGIVIEFVAGDQIAISVLNCCYRKGISVPQQLSVVGFDDVRPASYVNPPLTTVRQPLQEMGKTAMEMVLDLIDKKSVQNKMLNCKLVVRESVAHPVGSGA